METNKAERLEQAVATLNELIALTRSCDLDDSAQFLAMARLNLLMDLNGITEEEFRALCAALDGGGRRHPSAHAGAARRKLNVAAKGADRLLGRSWHGAELAALQASRTRVK